MMWAGVSGVAETRQASWLAARLYVQSFFEGNLKLIDPNGGGLGVS